MNVLPTTKRRLVVGVCLVVYLQAAGFFPALLAAAATFEGSHVVSYNQSNDNVRIVLHHQPGTLHRHSAASRLVCEFAARRTENQADHIACFSCNTTSERLGSAPKTKVLSTFPQTDRTTISLPHLTRTQALARDSAGPIIAARERERFCVLLI